MMPMGTMRLQGPDVVAKAPETKKWKQVPALVLDPHSPKCLLDCIYEREKLLQ